MIGCTGWDEIFGQERATGYLRDAVARGDVPHALLFTGPKGVGKFSSALLLAAAAFCPSRGPDGCHSCVKVARGVHPDLHLVEAEGNEIRIVQVQDLERELAMKPAEAGRRVAIVDEANSMNREAANSFLKILEEPPPDTYIILVAESRESLLPTVASRCREVRFSALGKRDIETYLVEREGLQAAEAERLARLSGGIFGRALLWARAPELAACWNRGVELAASLRRSSLLRLLEEAGEVTRSLPGAEAGIPGGEDAEAYLKAMDKRARERMEKLLEGRRKRESARVRRQAALDLFDGMSSFYRDIMLLNLADEAGREAPEPPLLNLEWRDELEREALHLGAAESMRRLEALQRAERALEDNVDLGLLLESLLLELKRARG